MNKVRLTEVMDSCEFRFEWLNKQTCGCAIFEDKLIVINYILCLADTIIHEMIHIAEPGWNEKKVLEETYKTLQRLTVEELTELVKEVMDRCQHSKTSD